eukprot:gene6534-biopygen11897
MVQCAADGAVPCGWCSVLRVVQCPADGAVRCGWCSALRMVQCPAGGAVAVRCGWCSTLRMVQCAVWAGCRMCTAAVGARRRALHRIGRRRLRQPEMARRPGGKRTRARAGRGPHDVQ